MGGIASKATAAKAVQSVVRPTTTVHGRVLSAEEQARVDALLQQGPRSQPREFQEVLRAASGVIQSHADHTSTASPVHLVTPLQQPANTLTHADLASLLSTYRAQPTTSVEQLAATYGLHVPTIQMVLNHLVDYVVVASPTGEKTGHVIPPPPSSSSASSAAGRAFDM
jgi:LysM repeat protein